VRYEDQHRRGHSYDHRDSKRSRTYSRSRSRSRSPPRRFREETHRDSRLPRQEQDRSRKVERNERPRDKVAEQTSQGASIATEAEQLKEKQSDRTKYVSTAAAALSNPNASSITDAQPETAAEPVVVDEAALIEERRKRREAMRNKYRGQATPLLVQALHLGAESSQDTPDPESSAPSPASSTTRLFEPEVSSSGTREATPASPRSPRSGPPGSPAAPSPAAQDDLSANGDIGSPAEDGPSAADYDPTIDMQEERARHDSRLFKEDEKSLVDADNQVVEKAAVESIEGPPKKKEFDMFADDDDDDMFAEQGPSKPLVESKAAQALDANMMDNWDDPEGYYITVLNELIDGRYSVTDTLGRGMFASVVRATDSKTNQPVAIKIVRNNESMRKAGVKELDILKDIAANDPENKKHVIRMLRSFDHKGHLCMVFENMSMNLREVLKKFGRDIGINIKAVRAYAQQLFLGLSLLRKCQYLHADLKPDNILVNEARNIIKIADLGSASPITENATAPYLVSRFYRAPEVILGITYDYGIDMWSVGCTLFELYTGKILFTGRNNNNMLRTIMECRGKFPHKVLRRGTLTYDYFDDLLNFRSQETDRVTGREMTRLVDIKAKPVKDLKSRLMPKGKKLDDQERKELELFLDLLDKCLDLRPEKRITPAEALKHPFVLRTK
jgi:serine/threonine-protein kinase PRP4